MSCGHVFPNAYLGRPQFALSIDKVRCTVSGLWEWRPQGLVVRAEELVNWVAPCLLALLFSVPFSDQALEGCPYSFCVYHHHVDRIND